MRVLVLDLGDVPTDLRLSLLRMLPQCGRQFTNVVVPHRDAHTVRSSAYPALLQILQSCNYHVRWHGAYGLKPKLRGIRDCRRALMEHGIDEFDDHDDSFVVRTSVATDRATATRALEHPSSDSHGRDAVCVRLRCCEDLRNESALQNGPPEREAHVADDVLLPESASHRITRLLESRNAIASQERASERSGRLTQAAHAMYAQLQRILQQLVYSVDADVHMIFSTGTVSVGSHNGTNTDPWDMLTVAAIGGRDATSHHLQTHSDPISLRQVFAIFGAMVSECAPPRTVSVCEAEDVIVAHGAGFRQVFLACRELPLRVVQWTPYLFQPSHVQVFNVRTDPMCVDDLALKPGWFDSVFARTLATQLLALGCDVPAAAVPSHTRGTQTEFRTLARNECVRRIAGMLPRETLLAVCQAQPCTLPGSTPGEEEVRFERHGRSLLVDRRWMLTGQSSVDEDALTMCHRVVDTTPPK